MRSTLLYHSLIRVLINASSFISIPQVEIMHMLLNYWAWHLFLNQILSNKFAEFGELIGFWECLITARVCPFISFIFHNFKLKIKIKIKIMPKAVWCVYFIILNNVQVQKSLSPAALNTESVHFLLKHFWSKKTERLWKLTTPQKFNWQKIFCCYLKRFGIK